MPTNIVFIMTDQQRYDMLGCNGSTIFKTPHLDRLASGGMRFTSGYTTTPVCTPARGALFTGMWPSSCGYVSNHDNAYRHVEFLGSIFSRAGFAAGYTGKWHLSGMEGGYYEMGRADGGFLDEYWYDGRRFINDVGKSGFEKWRKGKDLQDADCWGTRVADRGVAFIERFHKQPFFLAVSFDEPHGPSSAPERYYALYRGTQRERAPNLSDMLENKPFIHQQLEKYYHGTGRVPAGAMPNNDPRYYGCNTFVDGQIGRVLDAVDRHCPENTIVVYTTDHGAHQGAHGLLAKGPTMYEETTHVPFIVRAPGVTRPGSVSNALVSHIDIAPTISELAGVPTHPQFQGQSLVPVLRNPTTGVQDAVFMEYARFGLEHDNHFGFVPIRCIRTERHKLVLNQTDMDELYDLQTDPWEMENRIDDPALSELRLTLHDRLLDWMNRRIDPLRGEMWYSRRWRPDHHIDPWAGEHNLKEN